MFPNLGTIFQMCEQFWKNQTNFGISNTFWKKRYRKRNIRRKVRKINKKEKMEREKNRLRNLLEGSQCRKKPITEMLNGPAQPELSFGLPV